MRYNFCRPAQDASRLPGNGRRHRRRTLEHGKPGHDHGRGSGEEARGDIDTALRTHVEKNVQQRRRQIVGDCFQLQVDVDHYNGAHPKEEQLSLILDMTEDVREMKVAAGIDDAA